MHDSERWGGILNFPTTSVHHTVDIGIIIASTRFASSSATCYCYHNLFTYTMTWSSDPGQALSVMNAAEFDSLRHDSLSAFFPVILDDIQSKSDKKNGEIYVV
jgi:hypothetical protein